MILMPLILIVVRIMNRRRWDEVDTAGSTFTTNFFKYGEGLMATGGMLYVFLILSGLFAISLLFERGGMRTLILSPIDRKTILLGKNLAMSVVALVLPPACCWSMSWCFVTSRRALYFVALTFFIFTALMSVMGNWCRSAFPNA